VAAEPNTGRTAGPRAAGRLPTRRSAMSVGRCSRSELPGTPTRHRGSHSSAVALRASLCSAGAPSPHGPTPVADGRHRAGDQGGGRQRRDGRRQHFRQPPQGRGRCCPARRRSVPTRGGGNALLRRSGVIRNARMSWGCGVAFNRASKAHADQAAARNLLAGREPEPATLTSDCDVDRSCAYA
jgi:hypothetical protein